MTVAELIGELEKVESEADVEIFNPTTFLRYDVEHVHGGENLVTLEVGEPTSL